MTKQNTDGLVRDVLVAVALAGFLGATAPAASVPLTVSFDRALSSTGDDRTLPFTINSTAQNLFLRFLVPDGPSVGSINSMSLTVTLHDDSADLQDESADIGIALLGPGDLFLGSVDPAALQGTTASDPFIFSHALSADEIDDFMAAGSLDNGAFRVRISRCCGDFVVVGGTASIDANLVPEPGALALLAAACGAFAVGRRRRTA